jgi:NitT/TauT family transport system substrate-binding protein
MTFGSGGGKLLTSVLGSMGIGAADYTRVTTGIGPAAAAALSGRQVDALVLWDAVFGAMENSGLKLRYIDLPEQDKMANFVVATTDKYMTAHPRVVEGMCRAMNKGLYFTRANTAAAIRIFFEEFPSVRPANVDPEKAIRDGVHMMNLWLNADLQNVPLEAKTGRLDPATWEYTQKLYRAESMLKGSKPATDGYTGQFFEACNRFDRRAVADAAQKHSVIAR